MRIQRNRGSRSAVHGADVYRPCLVVLMGSPMQIWPGRGLPSPSRKGAGVWLPK
jgi:hypothetical protein